MDSYEEVGNSEILGGMNIQDIKRSDTVMGKSVWGTLGRLIGELGKSYVELFSELTILIKKNIYKVFRSVLIGVVAFAVCVGLALGVLYLMGTYNKYIFTTDNWETYKSDRINMVEDMESKFDFIGMKQIDVEKILGKPNYETTKDKCEYISLSKKDYDKVVEYELNNNSRSIADIIEKNYVVAYKDNEVIYAEVLIADKISK